MFNGQFPIKVLKKASAALAKLEQMRSKSAGSAFGETSKRSEDVWKKNIPSGNLTKNYGKSPFLMVKFTIMVIYSGFTY